MPTYEYECKSCSHNFEVFQSMSDDSLTECPECRKEIRRVIGGGLGIIFKGSGFYVNDSKSGSKSAGKSESKTGSGKDSDTGSSDSSSKETPKSGGSDSPSEKKSSDRGSTQKKTTTAVKD
ncbi:MAG: hypothetical protein HN368_24400 [Spirochaetales bacterium]|jgi:putative FmdB family regulatory protein|nr:hypothetical protein [Spirochaetales bacterium]